MVNHFSRQPTIVITLGFALCSTPVTNTWLPCFTSVQLSTSSGSINIRSSTSLPVAKTITGKPSSFLLTILTTAPKRICRPLYFCSAASWLDSNSRANERIETSAMSLSRSIRRRSASCLSKSSSDIRGGSGGGGVATTGCAAGNLCCFGNSEEIQVPTAMTARIPARPLKTWCDDGRQSRGGIGDLENNSGNGGGAGGSGGDSLTARYMTCPHFGHWTRLPLKSSGIDRAHAQTGQLTTIQRILPV